jgi:hypothetical protein
VNPCGARNIDREGGVIGIALLQFDAGQACWQLFRKDHEKGTGGIPDQPKVDPERMFWQ